MATLTVTAAAQPANVPPRVLVTVTDSGTPLVASATVIRTGSDGTQIVRTPDGLPLAINGTTHIGTVYDYEASFDVSYVYSTIETPVTPSSSVTLTSAVVWLVHPGTPLLSMPVLRGIESHREHAYTANLGIFDVQGRADAIVITDGRRKTPSGTLTVMTQTTAELLALRAVVRDLTPLLLNVPATMQMGLATSYLSIGDVSEVRETDADPEPFYTSSLPYRVVGRPVGGSTAARSYADPLTELTSYLDARQSYTDYQDFLTG